MIPLLLAIFAPWVAVAADPCSAVQPQLQDAAKALEAQDWTAAERILQPLAAATPQCVRILVAVGRLQLGRRNYPEAEKYSELALSSGPEDAQALLLRGELLLMRGKNPEAQAWLEKSVKLEPNNADAHFQLGAVFDRARKNPEAVREFLRVTQLRPDDARAFDYLALNLEPMGEIARAEAAYKQGLLVNQGPRFDGFLDYNYGKLLLKLNRLDEAKQHLDQALKLAPKVRAVRYDHAKLCLRLGKPEDARIDAEAALAAPDPSGFILDLQVYNLLVNIFTRLGETDLARQYAQLAERTSVPLRSRDRR